MSALSVLSVFNFAYDSIALGECEDERLWLEMSAFDERLQPR